MTRATQTFIIIELSTSDCPQPTPLSENAWVDIVHTHYSIRSYGAISCFITLSLAMWIVMFQLYSAPLCQVISLMYYAPL